ncbi:hypothetical protein Pfo_028202 [Paulownia fortunei]|nr:hypothetical protein Pfo_028202 [Paulownia fortunei]
MEAFGPHRATNYLHENNLDPDDGNSLSCSACRLPIFSTPFIKINNSNYLLHDQCANLPKELMDHVLHPGQPLILQENHPTLATNSCVKCKALCGSMFYKCPDSACALQLDVLCSMTIKILHRSHEHRLMVTRGIDSFCDACGTRHYQGGRSVLSYLCNVCGFWIHPDCASLPNAINLHAKHHRHPLVLTYALPRVSVPGYSKPEYRCAICRGIIRSLGVYFCDHCRYYAHIRCAMSDPQSFKPVLIRDAQLPDLFHFPMADEHTSAIPYIRENTRNGGTSSSSDHEGRRTTTQSLHEHPLILHDHDDNVDHPRVCNGCVQLISPPFYSCSECTDFFLHSYCAHLPGTLTEHPVHKQHPLFLVPKPDPLTESTIYRFFCNSCKRLCNGFAYSCKTCSFHLDVVCAFMPASITHDAHGKTHILYSRYTPPAFILREKCHCCGSFLKGVSYECRTCRRFKLHARCALLPDTVRHKFDQHPLKLITTSKWPQSEISQDDQLEQFCEICEKDIDNRLWYYSCNECDRSFHIDCIPSLDPLSKMKLGVSVRVQCHGCPLTSVRALTVYGYRCGYCRETIRDYDKLAFECSKCYFRIHEKCARICLLELEDED